jgi:hypothetical protein
MVEAAKQSLNNERQTTELKIDAGSTFSSALAACFFSLAGDCAQSASHQLEVSRAMFELRRRRRCGAARQTPTRATYCDVIELLIKMDRLAPLIAGRRNKAR